MFKVYDGWAASAATLQNRWVAMWGYRRLVCDQTHRDGLAELDPDAPRVFAAELRDTP